MAKKSAVAIHCIHLKGFEKPIRPGEKFSADAKSVDELIADGAAKTLGQAEQSVEQEGEAGGDETGDQLPGLTGKNKDALLGIAEAEGVVVAGDATNAEIVAAIEAARAGDDGESGQAADEGAAPAA